MNTQTHEDRASERQIGDTQERAKEVVGAAIQNLGGQWHMSRIALERWNIDTSRFAILSTEPVRSSVRRSPTTNLLRGGVRPT